MNALATQPPQAGECLAQAAGFENSPELQLLLCCARRKLGTDSTRHALDLLGKSLNWNFLIEQACVHGLFPLLYWHWTRTLGQHFPFEIEQQLNDRFRANVAHSLLLIQDLVNVVELLGRRNIPVIPFKGPALAESLYGNAPLRECADLDFLVRAREVPEAIRTLDSAGYHAPARLTPAQQKAFLATQYEYAFLSPAGTLVELQWRILPRYFSVPLPEPDWGSMRLTVFGREMHALSSEHLLLLLCFHGCKHGWSKLIWLADVGELIASNPHLDWPYVLDHARRAGGLRMLLLGVVLANKLLGTAIPHDLKQPLSGDPTVEQIAASICRHLVTEERPTYVQSQVYLLRVRERWRDRLRYIVRFTFTATPEEWKIVDLPPRLFVLYSFLRVLRGVVKGLTLAVATIRGG